MQTASSWPPAPTSGLSAPLLGAAVLALTPASPLASCGPAPTPPPHGVEQEQGAQAGSGTSQQVDPHEPDTGWGLSQGLRQMCRGGWGPSVQRSNGAVGTARQETPGTEGGSEVLGSLPQRGSSSCLTAPSYRRGKPRLGNRTRQSSDPWGCPLSPHRPGQHVCGSPARVCLEELCLSPDSELQEELGSEASEPRGPAGPVQGSPGLAETEEGDVQVSGPRLVLSLLPARSVGHVGPARGEPAPHPQNTRGGGVGGPRGGVMRPWTLCPYCREFQKQSLLGLEGA